MAQAQHKLHLYDHPVSSYAQKVRIALREKGLDFSLETPKDLGSGHDDVEFSAANPRKEVPTLVVSTGPHDSFSIFDSTTILMYLEDAFPHHKSLLPRDPRHRANARMIEDVCDTHYEATNWAIGEIRWFHRAVGEQANALLLKARQQTESFLEFLTSKLGEGPFLAGDQFTYADIAAAPVVNRSVFYGYGPQLGSPLQKWHERVATIPSVKVTFEEMLEAANALSSIGPDVWKPHGGRRREYRDHRLEWFVKNGGVDIVLKGLEDDNIRFSWP